MIIVINNGTEIYLPQFQVHYDLEVNSVQWAGQCSMKTEALTPLATRRHRSCSLVGARHYQKQLEGLASNSGSPTWPTHGAPRMQAGPRETRAAVALTNGSPRSHICNLQTASEGGERPR